MPTVAACYDMPKIYSPDVPVFRDDRGTLFEEPYLCSFISAPAVNAKVVLERDSWRLQEIRDVMRERIGRVLAIAAHHEHDVVVLGAWGVIDAIRREKLLKIVASIKAAQLRSRPKSPVGSALGDRSRQPDEKRTKGVYDMPL